MSTLLLIDGNSMANRAFYGVPHLTSAQGVPTNAVYGFLNTLQAVMERFGPDGLVVTFDVSKKVFRHERFADYKGTRTGMPEDLLAQMPLIKEALGYLGITTLGMEGYEADDLIGTLSAHQSAQGGKSYILSGDRDLFQLVSDDVTVCFPKGKGQEMEIVTPAFLKDTYGLTPEEVIELKGLMGDKSDNIPGVRGVGEKTAKKLLDQYGTVEGLYDHLEDLKGKKLYDKLLEGKADAFLSKELATIKRDVPIDFAALDVTLGEVDVSALTTFYQTLGLNKLLARLEAAYGTTTLKGAEEEEKAAEGTTFANIDQALAALQKLAPGTHVVLVDGRGHDVPTRLSWRSAGANVTVQVASEEVWALLADALEEVFTQDGYEVLTDDAKRFAFAMRHEGCQIRSVVFDVSLSDYLLDPESGDHDLARAAEVYLGKTLPEEEPSRAFAALEAVEALHPLLWEKLEATGTLDLYREVELPLSWILAQMEVTGVRVDTDYLQTLQQEFDDRIQAIEKDIEIMAGEPVNPNSTKQLGHILFEVMGLPVVKKTKTGYSTSADVLETLRADHPIAGRILDYRQLAKLKSTYVDGLLKLVDERDRVHTSFNQTVTATGRLSSTAPNLQNIPVRTDEGKRIRRAFIPIDARNILISADYSQIELRVLAHLSEDDTLIKAFQEGEDIHRRTASEVFHVPMDAVSSEQRRTAKAVNFGIIYGQTDFGLSKELGISRREAQAYIDLYFSRYPLVQTFIHETIEKARQDGYVTTMMGRRRYIKDIASRNRNLRQFAERTAVNSPIQGTAADIIKLAMLRSAKALRDRGIHAQMLLQVHDELIFEVTREDALALSQTVRSAMEEAVTLKVPLKVDLKAGFNWQEMEHI